MDIVNNVALISINETLVVQLLSFLVFLFIINRIMFRPLRETMAERDIFMETIREDIAAANNELKSLHRTTQERSAAIRQEAMAVKATVEEAAHRQAAEVIAATQQQISQLSATTEKEVSAMVATARKDLQKEAKQLTVDIMEKILDRKLAS